MKFTFQNPQYPEVRGTLNLDDYPYPIACQTSLTSKVAIRPGQVGLSDVHGTVPGVICILIPQTGHTVKKCVRIFSPSLDSTSKCAHTHKDNFSLATKTSRACKVIICKLLTGKISTPWLS